MKKPNIIWQPFEGAQTQFLSCPVWECLLHGSRSGGKTDALLMDFLQGVGKGHGADYNGLLLREATTELGDVIKKCRKWIPRIFPSAKYNASTKVWRFEDGESLWLNYARVLADYDQYHGHEYTISDASLIKLPDNKVTQAKNIKVHDFVQTLQGAKKVKKVFKSKKAGVTVSVLDSDLNVIGTQQQGLLHPVLTNAGWQRIGLSCLFQVNEQSTLGELFLKEVFQFLADIHQESLAILRLWFSGTQIVFASQLKVQLSFLYQVFYQFYALLLQYSLISKNKYYEPHELLVLFQNDQICKILGSVFFYKHPLFIQLLYYCVFLISFVKQISSIISGIMKSKASAYDQFELQDQHMLAKSYLCNYHQLDSLHIVSLVSDELRFDTPRKQTIHKFTDNRQNLSYVNPYSFERKSEIVLQDKTKIDFCSFMVSPFSSPVSMVDFEIEDEHHYISVLGTKRMNHTSLDVDKIDFHIQNSRQYQVVSSNCFIGWEELTNQHSDEIYLKLMSCNRSPNPKIQKKYRATCNPSGAGHGWVKKRFIDAGKPGEIIVDEYGMERTHIPSSLEENKILLANDPTYKAKLLSMTKNNKMLRDAWVYGSWDLVIGGFFTDVWDPDIHILPDFEIPTSWTLLRSFDWGSSRPWAVSYVVVANGEQPRKTKGVKLPYFPVGTSIVIYEIYGWSGKVNQGDRATSQEIAERVLEVDKKLFTEYKLKCVNGPADTSIWEVRDGSSIAQNLARHGCRWTKAYKGAGSRIAGWAIIRQMLGAAKRHELESPHLYFLRQATHHIRTLPMAQRDPKKPEDIDTTGEDHALDSLRYLLSRKMTRLKQKKIRF